MQAKGHRFFSSGDSEVVVKAYAEWGLDFVDHLIGMFAVAITERDTGRLVLARDRLGIKPLYLAETPGVVRFASTLPALLAGGGVDTAIDHVALAHYLSFHSIVPPPRTILRGVTKLPPATVRVYEPDGRTHERVYWDPSFTRASERADWSEQDWQDALLESLTTAVRRRMVADVPVGVLLSGGLDSSLVVALLAGEGQSGLSTFSIGFDSVGGREGDEFVYSDLIAKTFDTDHHQLKVAAGDLVPPLEAAVAAMSEPMVSHDCVAFYLLSQEVSRHVRWSSPGRAPTRSWAATTGTRRWPASTGSRRSRRTRRRSSTGTRPAWRGCSTRTGWPTATRRGSSWRRTWPGRGRRPRSTPACGSTPRSCSPTTR